MKRLFLALGLVLLSASLGSCGSDKPTSPALTTRVSWPSVTVKTPNNSGYRTPALSGPVPRNPDLDLRADCSKVVGISFTRVPVTDKYIAMTFDDGPHPQNTPRLLDMLRARNIKATFYVVGSNVDLYPQIVRRTVAEGHEIGNHSYTHGWFTKMSDSEIREELSRCRDAVGRAAGVQPRTLRPPYGGLLQRQREWVHAEFGYPTVLWSVDPLDWKRPGPSVVCSRILSSTTPGSIILSHDLHAPTVDAMPATLDGLLRRGFKFVTVSQLLAMQGGGITAQASVHAPVP
ncbi:MAG: polysaccharide deacetylase family protein [Verrucomicrobia bacterium]|nr:polysaccharide deacetylase family protein [Verrucomicrobiota bacterium]